ncbi:hypothetical protein AKJ65_01235 [candidate division MSBL1 archaeon SCGC-AAA259E19]|uniref:Major facilitator superfamily (MFS) profile domain-containing protein n=1 Tax=candidate division MSBL1 archaeon SCGC-AAA259E19 TaxID=1698264 RepID=A0A133UN71_9EURY|nr:hypothetical protein AKJ65_01235 [candidate division MSBL1 archaeon SCGC-AAA259E19]
MFPTLMLWVGDISSPSHLGRFSSYLTTFGFLGQFFAPIFLDPVLKSLGINEVFLVASLASMAGLVFSLLNLSRRKS